MALSSVFKIRTEVTHCLLELLQNTTLGTNGAKYKHLDTYFRILEADNPLFISLERNEKTIGNVTFCMRPFNWYARYFAFQSFTHAGSTRKSNNKSSSLKQELNTFFEQILEGKHSDNSVDSIYAYIDPKNERSKWMSEDFGFNKIATLATQSYSRINPKISKKFSKISDWNEIQDLVKEQYGKHQYFFTGHSEKPPFYCLKDNNGEILAFAKVTKVDWEIVRLPGRMGGVMTRIIPFIPFLNKLIRPKLHTFLAPEIVYVSSQNTKLLEDLFSSILATENCKLMLWWIDQNDPIYLDAKKKIYWGLLHKIIGVHPVDVVERRRKGSVNLYETPVFVTAFDLV